MGGAATASAGLVTSITAFVESQVQTLGTGAFQAMATPGSTMWVVLTASLTLMIALIGYNLLLGHAPSLREGMFTMAKLAIVLGLATSWPVYQVLVYDVAIKAPAEVASEIGRPTGIPGSGGSLPQRLDRVDGALVQLSILGAGTPATPPMIGDGVAPQPWPGFDTFALGGARILFLVVAIGSLIMVRIVTGLMLALGPLFAGFLLFAATRSLFEGWIKVLIGAGFASLALAFEMGLQLMLVEPWLGQVLARRAAGEFMPSLGSDLLVIFSLFAIVVAATLYAIGRLVSSFRFAPAVAAVFNNASSLAAPAPASAGSIERSIYDRSRSELISEHLVNQQRRERSPLASADRTSIVTSPATPGGRSADGQGLTERGLGHSRSARRGSRQRVSASSERRDSVR